MKLYRLSGQTSVLAALLLSGVLLAGCGQEDEADSPAVPEETAQDQQNGGMAQDDQFVSEQESVGNDSAMENEAGMEGEPTSGVPAQENEPLTGDATEDPGFGDGTDPMPGDGEDASDLAANGSEGSESDDGNQSDNVDSEEGSSIQ